MNINQQLSFPVTPLDVVKIRLQSQATPSAFAKGNCFLYCNGLMDHLCVCANGIMSSAKWYKRPSQFNGTFVSFKKHIDVINCLSNVQSSEQKNRVLYLNCT